VALCKYRKLKSAVGDNKERIKESNAKQVTLRGITNSATHSKLRVSFVGATNVFIVYYQTGKSVMVDVGI